MINSCGEVTGKDDSLHDNDLDDDGDDDDDDDDGDDVDDGDDDDDDADGLRCFQQRLLRASNGFYGCSTPPASSPCESDTDLLHYLKCSKYRQTMVKMVERGVQECLVYQQYFLTIYNIGI